MFITLFKVNFINLRKFRVMNNIHIFVILIYNYLTCYGVMNFDELLIFQCYDLPLVSIEH